MNDYSKTGSRNCPSGSFAYTIRSGDTLWILAQRYKTTVEAIMAINPGINPNNLQIGQVICIPGAATPPPTSCPSGSFRYTIRSGDTLWILAQRYNTTVEAIMAINPGINPNNLQIGQVICIPGEATPPPTSCPSGSFRYTIRSGDTLWILAQRYNTTVEAIIAINPGINPNNLQIGQTICIPEETPPTRCPAGSFEYTIRQGDTLYELARRYDTTVNAILAINPGLDPNNLRIGMVICIPEGTTPKPCDGYNYIVRQGDTLYSIANMFNTTVSKLMAANPGVDPNNLRVGMIICIPRCDVDPKPSCLGGTIYVIRPKDTLSSILMKFNISVMDLMEGNPDINIDKLMVGQELCILPHMDRGCPCPKGTDSYVIVNSDLRRGEPAVVSLADKFKIKVSTLLKANPNLAPDDFKVGVRICIPK